MHTARRLRTLAVSLLAALPATAQQPDTLRHSIPAPPVGAESDAFLGGSVALDGAYAVVGAAWDDLGAQDAGVVKVFSATTGALLLVIPNPGPAANEYFGESIAISGTRVVIGAYQDAAGAGRAYVYDLASATPTVPVATLDNPHPASAYHFGTSVAISGARVVVGVRYTNNAGLSDVGRAYVFDLASATPTAPVATLDNPTPAQNDSFGAAVAISGTRVVIGAYGDFAGASSAGSAYVYDLASGTPTVPAATLNNPSPAFADLFGYAVAISGTRVVVAARDDDTGASNAGSAYVYDMAGATPTVPIATLDNPSPTADDRFGSAVAIHGTRVVVGASGDEAGAPYSGSAYVYDVASATPTVPVATLNNPAPAQYDAFGTAVAISGTRVLSGASGDDTGATNAGSAYLYELTGGTPTVPVATLNDPGLAAGDRFGSAVAVSGTLMVVGAINDDTGAPDAGRAHVYDLASATPTVPLFTLNNPSPAFTDNFGAAVAIAGSLVVIGTNRDDTGALDAGSAYVYDLASGTPTVPLFTLNNPSPAESDNFGFSVAISGTRVAVGAYSDDTGALDAGSAYVYDLAGATPTVPLTINNPSPAIDERFGASVALSGTRMVVGASFEDTGGPNAGSAYVYDLAGATPTVPVATLNNPTPSQGEAFGASAGISGTRVVIGAGGNAYVYDLAGATPALPVATLPGGSPVAISGTRVVTAAFERAYVYDMASATPALPVATLNNPSPGANDAFGSAVAIDGTTVAVGAPLDDTVALDKGYAYVFGPANADFDGDGLLDIWEWSCFGSTAVATALDDTDGDGRNELLELAFNADPTMSDLWAAPAVTSEGGFLTMTIQKRAGVSYLVQTAGSPDAAAFSAATTTTLINTATTLKVRDNFTPATAAERLIRVKVSAAP